MPSEREVDAMSELTQQKIVDIVNAAVQANSLQTDVNWNWQPTKLCCQPTILCCPKLPSCLPNTTSAHFLIVVMILLLPVPPSPVTNEIS
jgi:hypothetical protein